MVSSDERTMKEKIGFAGGESRVWDFNDQVAPTEKAQMDTLEYAMCVEIPQATHYEDDPLGPQTRAKYKCDYRIDAIEDEAKRIEAENIAHSPEKSMPASTLSLGTSPEREMIHTALPKNRERRGNAKGFRGSLSSF